MTNPPAIGSAEQLQARIRELEKALMVFGEHAENCPAPRDSTKHTPCDCGLGDAILNTSAGMNNNIFGSVRPSPDRPKDEKDEEFRAPANTLPSQEDRISALTAKKAPSNG